MIAMQSIIIISCETKTAIWIEYKKKPRPKHVTLCHRSIDRLTSERMIIKHY